MEGKILGRGEKFEDQATRVTFSILGMIIVGAFKGVSALVGYSTGWRDGECAVCHTKLRYNINEHGPAPHYCQHHAPVSGHGGDMFRRDLIPPGWESSLSGKVQTHKDHITMVFLGKGTNGKAYTVSWDRYGEGIHWTDLGVPMNHPDRHRDPRR